MRRSSSPASRVLDVLLVSMGAAAAGANGLEAQAGRVRCGRCHADREFLAGKGGSAETDAALFVTDSLLDSGRHGTLTCTSCHLDFDDVYPHQPSSSTMTCGGCHDAEEQAWSRSLHAAKLATSGDGPACVTCHGVHRVLGREERESPVHPLNEAALCARCHEDARVIETYFSDPADSVARNAVIRYHETVHGLALSGAGLIVTATCSSCHGPHRILPSDSTASRVHRDSIPATCGACHAGVLEEFDASAHGSAFREGRSTEDGHAAPVCNDCHSAHGVAPTDAVWRAGVVEECGVCHERLYETYRQTYHGKVTRLGSTLAAMCSDCHTAHANLPPDDIASSVHRSNLVTTCAACHERASASFVQYASHGDHRDREQYPVLYWTWLFMTTLLFGVLSFFGMHTGLWVVRSALGGLRRTATAPAEKGGVATDTTPDDAPASPPVERGTEERRP